MANVKSCLQCRSLLLVINNEVIAINNTLPWVKYEYKNIIPYHPPSLSNSSSDAVRHQFIRNKLKRTEVYTTGQCFSPEKNTTLWHTKVRHHKVPYQKVSLEKLNSVRNFKVIFQKYYSHYFTKHDPFFFLIPAATKDLPLFENFHTGSGELPTSYSVRTRTPSLGPKRPGRHTDHSPSTSAEFNNKRISTSTTPIRLYCEYRINCTFTANYVRQRIQTRPKSATDIYSL